MRMSLPGGVGGGGAASRMAGRAATNESACSVVRISGGASRSTSAAGALTMKPASRAARAAAGAEFSVSTMPSSRPSPRTWSISGWPRSSTPVAMCLPSASTWSSRPSVVDGVEHGERGGGAHRVAGEGRPVLAGLQQRARPRRCRSSAPIGMPPPRPLARVITSGTMPDRWCASQLPVRPMPVCTSSITSSAPRSAVIRLACGEIAVRRRDHAGLAEDRLQEHRGDGLVDRAPAASGMSP